MVSLSDIMNAVLLGPRLFANGLTYLLEQIREYTKTREDFFHGVWYSDTFKHISSTYGWTTGNLEVIKGRITGITGDINDFIREHTNKQIADVFAHITNTYIWQQQSASQLASDLEITQSDIEDKLETLEKNIKEDTAEQTSGTAEEIEKIINEPEKGLKDVFLDAIGKGFVGSAADLQGFSSSVGLDMGQLPQALWKTMNEAMPAIRKAAVEVLLLKSEVLFKDIRQNILDLPLMKSERFQEFVRKFADFFKPSAKKSKDALAIILIMPWEIMYDAIINFITPKTKPTYETAHQSATNFLALSGDLNVVMGILDLIAAIYSLGQLKSVSKFLNNIIWTFGLGWLSWIVLGTPFRKAIAEPMENYYTELYRTKKSSVTEIKRWYRKGLITFKQFNKELGELGVPFNTITRYYAEGQEDIAKDQAKMEGETLPEKIKLANVSHIKRLYLEQLIDGEQASARLDELTPKFEERVIEETVTLWNLQLGEILQKEENASVIKKEIRQTSLAHIKRLYLEQLIDDEQASERLSAFEPPYTERFIEETVTLWNLQLGENLRKEEASSIVKKEIRQTSIEHVKALFLEEILTKKETTARLLKFDPVFPEGFIKETVTLWDLQLQERKRQEQLKLDNANKQLTRDLTLAQAQKAFQEGIFSLPQLQGELARLGFDKEETKIITDIEGKKKEVETWLPSIAKIGGWYKDGIINRKIATIYWTRHNIQQTEINRLIQEYTKVEI